MQESSSQLPKILITGGTSGLGHELVKIFLEKGYYVVTTGRRDLLLPESGKRLSMYKVDFSDLKTTADVFRQIAEAHQFDVVINNAGILSPPKLTLTNNGMEYTFQVNFLAHLLADEIILNKLEEGQPMTIASVTSPVYRLASIDTGKGKRYRALKSYSDSKLYLVLISKHLPEVHPDKRIVCFSFDPGTFGSGIYRMQSRFFSTLYWIAAPFMRKPSKVANVLGEIITRKDISGNVIYNVNNRVRPIPATDKGITETFWKECYEKISPFL
jgi:NAD(P)-dependent dehydrogenase (short-subunit alcohol dehydrogenase family)